MDKILLLNPPDLDGRFNDIEISSAPPIGLCYIAAYLIKNNFDVELVDLNFYDNYLLKLKSLLRKHEFRLIGITAATPQINIVKEMISIIKTYKPETKVAVGGHHVSASPEDSLEYLNADIAVVGEGEHTMYELAVSDLNNYSKLKSIQGIAFKLNGNVKINPKRDVILDLDKLPHPAYSLLPIHKYGNMMTGNAFSVISSRGCPFSCSFCAGHVVHCRKYRARKAKEFVDELEYWNKNLGIRNFNFHDDLFTLYKKRAIDICNEIIKRNLKITWCCSARADTLDKEVLSYLKKAGCYMIGIGIESGDQNVLSKTGKGLSLRNVPKIIKWCKELNLRTWGYFIIGLPGDNKTSIMNTIKFAVSSGLDEATFSIFVPYPGTPYWNKLSETKKGTALDCDKFQKYGEQSFNFTNLPLDALRRYYKKAMVKFYVRPSYILRRLSKINDIRSLLLHFKVLMKLLLFN